MSQSQYYGIDAPSGWSHDTDLSSETALYKLENRDELMDLVDDEDAPDLYAVVQKLDNQDLYHVKLAFGGSGGRAIDDASSSEKDGIEESAVKLMAQWERSMKYSEYV